jgi:hypothetical protein
MCQPIPNLFTLKISSALQAAAVLAALSTGCGEPVQQSKLLGSWQVEAPTTTSIVFSFHPDKSYEMAVTGQPGAVLGTWKLQGNKLTKTMVGVTNASGTGNILSGAAKATTNTITRLTGSVMVWREDGSWVTLKRVQTTATAE